MPGGVWALGFVSLFMDISSEMIHAPLPLYLVTVLGTSLLTVGVIEGIAEATTAIMKIFSGALRSLRSSHKWISGAGISRPHARVWLQHHHDRHRSGTLGITHG